MFWIDGIYVNIDDTSSAENFANAIPGWNYEKLTIVMNDDGLAHLKWLGQTEELGIENENVGLLPFNDVKERIKTQLSVYYYVNDDPVIDEYHVNVTDIALQYMRMPVKNNYREGRLVPVWAVYGNQRPDVNRLLLIEEYIDKFQMSREEAEITADALLESNKTPVEPSSPLVVINALDGSAVDPILGY